MMDTTTISQLADLLTKGGPVVFMFAIWIAFRAGQTAKEAAKALNDIRDAVVKNGPLLEQIHTAAHATEENTVEASRLLESANTKLTALLAQRGVPTN